MGNTLGGATCILTCTSHTGSEFSEQVVRTTLTNKTVSVGNQTSSSFLMSRSRLDLDQL